jgi:hypothetical protein
LIKKRNLFIYFLFDLVRVSPTIRGMAIKNQIVLSLAWLGVASFAPAQDAGKVADQATGTQPALQAGNESEQAGKQQASNESDQEASKKQASNESDQEASKKQGGQASPLQSAARPYNLSIVAPVQVAASDAASKDFQTHALPGMLATERKLLPEYQYHSAKDLAAISLDPSKLVLSADTTARVYFLGEGAGYQNTLGISTTGGGPLSPGSAMIFPNASNSVSFGGSGAPLRSTSEPLLAGDFVNLGTLKAGSALDFFLIANGAVGGTDFVSTNQSLNRDGIVHAVATAKAGSPYLVISFEDMKGGGDRDYNDVFFAVDLGRANVEHLMGLGAPEPSLALGALLAGGSLLGFSRRRCR